MPEIIAKAKANPGKLNWTSPGVGTTPHLAGEVLKLRTGIEHAAHSVRRRRTRDHRRARPARSISTPPISAR